MLLTSVSVVFLLLAAGFCALAALAFARALQRYQRSRYAAASWFDATRWPVFLVPALSGGILAALLLLVDLPGPVCLALAGFVAAGLLLLSGALALRSRVTVSTGGVATWDRAVQWNAVDDYAETGRGLALFYNDGAQRCRFDVAVPRRCRTRVTQITSACLDARFEYAARFYAGHQALEG